MFAINGPSGPTSRHERRVVTDAEKQQRAAIAKHDAQKKADSFFNVRTPAVPAKSQLKAAKSASTSSGKTAMKRRVML
ncbi:hypothetical protein FI667_g1228, partial [Globisporangium splendens]